MEKTLSEAQVAEIEARAKISDPSISAWQDVRALLADRRALVEALKTAQEHALKQDAPFVALGRCQEALGRAEEVNARLQAQIVCTHDWQYDANAAGSQPIMRCSKCGFVRTVGGSVLNFDAIPSRNRNA